MMGSPYLSQRPPAYPPFFPITAGMLNNGSVTGLTGTRAVAPSTALPLAASSAPPESTASFPIKGALPELQPRAYTVTVDSAPSISPPPAPAPVASPVSRSLFQRLGNNIKSGYVWLVSLAADILALGGRAVTWVADKIHEHTASVASKIS